MRAEQLAKEYHAGQVDKQGKDYFTHLVRVMGAVCDKKELMVPALLHDILEDTECTREILEENRISERNIEIIEKLTRRKDEKYFDYVDRVRLDTACKEIKIEDLKDNLRAGCPDSLVKRYRKALHILMDQ